MSATMRIEEATPKPAIDPRRAQKSIKTLFGWLIIRRISLPLSLMVARTRVTPSQITALGLGLGLAGGGLMATGRYGALVAGGVLAVIAKIMDAMDGEVARAKGVETAAGYVADGLCDRLRDSAVITGLGIGAYRAGSPSALAWTLAAIVAYLAFFYVSGAFPAHWREVRSEADLDDKHMFRVAGAVRLGAGDTLAVATLLGAVSNHALWVVIAIAFAGPLATALKVRRLFVLRPWEREDAQGA